MLDERRVLQALTTVFVAALVAAGSMASSTLDDRTGLAPPLLVGCILVAPVIVGLAERWAHAFLWATGLWAVAVVAVWWAYSAEVRNTALCQQCGTCCEGAAMLLLFGIPMFGGGGWVLLAAVSGAMRGGVALYRRRRATAS